MTYYPIYLQLKQRTVLLVGGGDIARQKLPALLKAGAKIRLVSPQALPDVQALVRGNAGVWRRRGYQTRDLEHVSLVIAATDDPKLQKRIAREARARRIWVNIVDVTPLCDFIAPSVVAQGDLQIAISTGGAAPALAKMIRQKLEPVIGPEYGELISILKRLRPEILQLPKARRQAFWKAVVSEEFLQDLKSHGAGVAEKKVKAIVHGKAAL